MVTVLLEIILPEIAKPDDSTIPLGAKADVKVIPKLLTVFPATVAFVVPVANQIAVSFSPEVLSKLPIVLLDTVAPLTPCIYRPANLIAFAPVVFNVLLV